MLRLKIVNQKRVLVIEKWGKFHRLGESGVNWLRLGDRVVNHIDLRTQTIDTKKQDVITKDSVILEIDAVLYFKVVDVMKATYNVQDYKNAMMLLVQTSVRNEIAKMTMEEALSSKEKMNQNLAKSLDEATDDWGVKVERVEIKDMKPSAKMAEAMEKERVAELERKAKVTEAQGEQDKEVKEAEGRKRSRVLNAEAEKEEAMEKAESIRIMTDAKAKEIEALAKAKAEEIKILAVAEAGKTKAMLDALKEAGVDENVIKMKYIEAITEMAKGDNKVFFPYADGQSLGDLALIGSTIREGDKVEDKK